MAPLTDTAPPTAASAASSNLTPTLFRRLFPRPYLERFLDQGIRPDGRTLDTKPRSANCWRDPSANTGEPSSSPSLASSTSSARPWRGVRTTRAAQRDSYKLSSAL